MMPLFMFLLVATNAALFMPAVSPLDDMPAPFGHTIGPTLAIALFLTLVLAPPTMVAVVWVVVLASAELLFQRTVGPVALPRVGSVYLQGVQTALLIAVGFAVAQLLGFPFPAPLWADGLLLVALFVPARLYSRADTPAVFPRMTLALRGFHSYDAEPEEILPDPPALPKAIPAPPGALTETRAEGLLTPVESIADPRERAKAMMDREIARQLADDPTSRHAPHDPPARE